MKKEIIPYQFFGCFKCLVNVFCTCLPQGIVKSSRKYRFGIFRLFAHFHHLFQQIFHILSLLFEPIGQIAICNTILKSSTSILTQPLFRFSHLHHFFGYFRLAFVKLLGLFSHIKHLLSKLARFGNCSLKSTGRFS
ncbi:hypothetical protein ACFLZ8_04295, partial [Planctomycetota bacterium]